MENCFSSVLPSEMKIAFLMTSIPKKKKEQIGISYPRDFFFFLNYVTTVKTQFFSL